MFAKADLRMPDDGNGDKYLTSWVHHDVTGYSFQSLGRRRELAEKGSTEDARIVRNNSLL